MSGGGGAQSWPVTCPRCGHVYILTNLMRRYFHPSGQPTDTHEIGHMRREGQTVQTRGNWPGAPIRTLPPILSPTFRGPHGRRYDSDVPTVRMKRNDL